MGKMLLVFALSLWGGSLMAAGPQDFYVHTTQTSTFKKIPTDNCRAEIKKTLCLVEPVADGKEFSKIDPLTRPCLSGGEDYAPIFESLYDEQPQALQKMYCSLKRIFIEKDFFGSAYAGLLKNPQGEVIGAQMGVRKSLLDEDISLTWWASWKEQLSFGGVKEDYTLTPGLPTVHVNGPIWVNHFLYFVVAHEFGHIFDFANHLNQVTESCPPETEENPDPECDFTKESFGNLSWATTKKALPKEEFKNRDKLCFYWCKETLNAGHIEETYAGLLKTNFISLYSGTQAWDDFAETLAYFLFFTRLSGYYQIYAGPYSIDVLQRFDSLLFKTKREYIERFLERTDLVYP